MEIRKEDSENRWEKIWKSRNNTWYGLIKKEEEPVYLKYEKKECKW